MLNGGDNMVKDSHAPKKKLKGKDKQPNEQSRSKGSSNSRHQN